MPFTSKERCCTAFTGNRYYGPLPGKPILEAGMIGIGIDEIEAIKLCDGERMSQKEAAARMQVSSGTVQRLLYKGRRKLIEAVCCAKPLNIYKPENIKITGDSNGKEKVSGS